MSWMPDFSKRSTKREIIDDMALDASETTEVLRSLEIVNTYLGGYSTTLDALDRLLPRGLERARVLDVGAGGGDMARRVVAWGRERGTRIEVVTVDLDAGAVEFARAALAGTPEARVVRADVYTLPFAERTFDVAICSLFLHHFEQEAAAGVLRAMSAVSRYGVVVNDLHRHPVAWASIWALTRVLGANPIVQHDAPLSVLRAFTVDDFDDLERRTGLALDVRWRWAFRYQVVIRGGIHEDEPDERDEHDL